jgi:hypothetical protein
VIGAAVDGRSIDMKRYRLRTRDWTLRYWAPSEAGAILSLSVPAASAPKLEIVARSPGIPPLPGVTINPRPTNVVPVQSGDVTLVRRSISIPPSQ